MAAGRARRPPPAAPGPEVSTSRAGTRDAAGDRRGAESCGDPTPPLPVIDQQCREIAAAAAALRRRLVMGRYAGFAAGFDAGLAVCGMLDTLARDHTRGQGTQRLRADALALTRHVNADLGEDHEAIRGVDVPTPPP